MIFVIPLVMKAILRDSFDYLESFVNNTTISLILIFSPRLQTEVLSFIDNVRNPKLTIYNNIPILAFSNLANSITLIDAGVDRVFS